MAPSQEALQPGFSVSKELSEHIHVVLIDPGESLNVGSVARAMSNLGFSHLHIVNPIEFDLTRAKKTACHGAELLEKIQFHDSLEQALGPMQEVIGFSGLHGKHRPQHVYLHEWLAQYQGSLPGHTALLFGPEDTGLTQEHIAHCRWLVRIPSTAENPSFNLAQSVLIALLEVARSQWSAIKTETQVASLERFYYLDRLVESVLNESGFYRPGTPEPIPDLVKNMLRRIYPDEREMGVLLALFSRLQNVLRNPQHIVAADAGRGSRREPDMTGPQRGPLPESDVRDPQHIISIDKKKAP